MEIQSNIIASTIPITTNESTALKDSPSNSNQNDNTTNSEASISTEQPKPSFPNTDTNTQSNVNANTKTQAETHSKATDTVIDIDDKDCSPISNTNDKDNEPIKRRTTLKSGEVIYIANVLKCCDEMVDIDAYQVMAFDNNTKETWKDVMKYIFDIIKCILCALTQVFGILILVYEVVKIGLQQKDWCNIPSTDQNGFWKLFLGSNLKVLAFLFSSFIAYFSIDRLTSVDKGMYWKMKYAEKIKWVDVTWLRVGFTVNLFVSIIAVYGSFLVIFFSDNSLDMVLNSVALFFIIELDDLLTKTSDYERIKEHVDRYDDDQDKMLKIVNKDEVNKCTFCCHIFCSKFGKFLGWFIAVPFHIIQYVTIGFCLFCPGLVVVCY